MNSICDQNFHPEIKYQSRQSPTFVSAVENKLIDWFQKVLLIARQWKQQRFDRQAFSHLLSLDEHILDDIGVTQNDVIWASRLPINVNASVELNKIARSNYAD